MIDIQSHLDKIVLEAKLKPVVVFALYRMFDIKYRKKYNIGTNNELYFREMDRFIKFYGRWYR